MADVAQLGLAVDSSQVKTATSDLNKMTEASKNAEKAATDLAKAGGGNAGGMSKQLEDSAKSADKLANTLASTRNASDGLTTTLGASRGALLAAAEAFGALSVGALAFGAGALIISEKWGAGQRAIEQSLIGIGQRTGETLQSLTKFSNDNASLTGLSLTEARNAALELTRTGNVAVSSLSGLGDAIHGYAVLTGTDAKDATKTFASALSGDLVKGAEQLNQTYGTMNSATLNLIRSLEVQGNRTAAVQVILDSMRESNLKAAESVSVLGKAYDGLKNVMDRVLNGPTKAASLDDGLADRQLAALQKQRDAIVALPGSMSGGGSKVLDDLNQQIDALQKKISGFSSDRINKQLNGLSEAGDNVVKSVIPQIDQINKLEVSLKQLEAARDTPGVNRSLGSGTDDAAAQAIQNTIDLLKTSQAEAARYNDNIAQIQQSWGGVSQSTAMALQQMQNQLPVAQAVTGAEQMQAQAAATFNNMLLQGKTSYEAMLVSAQQLDLAQAAATSSVMRQVDAIKDSTKMLLAQQNGTEAQTAAAIAYKNAIQSGADETSAAALASATLQNNLMKSAIAAGDMGESLAQAAASMKAAYDALDSANESSFRSQERAYEQAYEARGTFDPVTMPKSGGTISANPLQNVPVFYAHGGGGKRLDIGGGDGMGYIVADSLKRYTPQSVADGYIRMGDYAGAINAIENMANYNGVLGAGDISGDQISLVSQLTQTLNDMTGDKTVQLGNLESELSWLKTMPGGIERDRAIIDLQKSIDQLKESTDDLSSTNRDLLSPYYSQDPRTSHIGFRSQGMASGGWVDVPGVPSANDNMTAIIPVASGERIFVDPMLQKRGLDTGSSSGDGKQTMVNITNHITVGADANKDQVGRTVFQATQRAARQLLAASQ